MALSLAVVAACATSASSTSPNGAASLAICTPTNSTPVDPINDLTRPFNHLVMIARATDALAMSSGVQALVHASVPVAVRAVAYAIPTGESITDPSLVAETTYFIYEVA